MGGAGPLAIGVGPSACGTKASPATGRGPVAVNTGPLVVEPASESGAVQENGEQFGDKDKISEEQGAPKSVESRRSETPCRTEQEEEDVCLGATINQRPDPGVVSHLVPIKGAFRGPLGSRPTKKPRLKRKKPQEELPTVIESDMTGSKTAEGGEISAPDQLIGCAMQMESEVSDNQDVVVVSMLNRVAERNANGPLGGAAEEPTRDADSTEPEGPRDQAVDSMSAKSPGQGEGAELVAGNHEEGVQGGDIAGRRREETLNPPVSDAPEAPENRRHIEDRGIPEVESHPSNVAVGTISLNQSSERLGIGKEVGMLMSDAQLQCIPEIQFDDMVVNKSAAYLAMLARIGLNSPNNYNIS